MGTKAEKLKGVIDKRRALIPAMVRPMLDPVIGALVEAIAELEAEIEQLKEGRGNG